MTSDAPFSASALHYPQESLDEGPAKRQGHSPEVEKQKNVSVCLDKVQYGLACVNSWGALPLPEYRIPYADYTFRLKIPPISRATRPKAGVPRGFRPFYRPQDLPGRQKMRIFVVR